MNTSTAPAARSASGRYVMAMVLGTALSALGPGLAGSAAAAECATGAVSDITRYCTACWRNARLHPELWTDCTQEVFQRLLERVSPEAWDRVLGEEGEERREFLRAIDAVKKRTQRARSYAMLPEAVADRHDGAERERAEQRQAVAEAAARLLSDRQQRIVQLSFEGWSVAEIGQHLDLPVARVSDEKYKAIRKLRDYLTAADRHAG